MITFENPDLLHLLWALPIQALLLGVYWLWRRRTLRQLGSPALEQRLLLGFSLRRFWVKNSLFALGLLLVALSIANPRRAVRIKPAEQNSSDVLIALDISNSMLARDVSPSRLEQARKFVQKLVQELEGERVGLIFFAGDAFPQMPLSTDYEALVMFVRNAQPDFITDQGTDIAAAIELAGRMIETDSEAGKALILISDGENHEAEALEQAAAAKEEGLLIYTVGVGTAGGTTLPTEAGEQRRDARGQTIRSSANESLLLELAQAGGGAAFHLREETRAIESLKAAVGRLQKTAVEQRAYTQYVSIFQWLLLPALLFLALEQILWWRKKTPAETT